MLPNAGANVDKRDTYGNTPLHYAAKDRMFTKLEDMKQILNFGGDINARDNNRETAVHTATKHQNYHSILKLLEYGISIRLQLYILIFMYFSHSLIVSLQASCQL